MKLISKKLILKKSASMKITPTKIALLSLLLSACANDPTHLIVAPEVTSTSISHYQNKQAMLKVTDMRTNKNIVQILRKDQAAELYSSQELLESIIQKTFAQQLKKQGLTVNTLSNNNIEVFVDKAVIIVEQTLMKYTATNEIVLRVKVNNGEQTLTNTFKTRGSSNGPLGADIAVLERDFNQQLASLLTQVLSNTDIQNFIR